MIYFHSHCTGFRPIISHGCAHYVINNVMLVFKNYDINFFVIHIALCNGHIHDFHLLKSFIGHCHKKTYKTCKIQKDTSFVFCEISDSFLSDISFSISCRKVVSKTFLSGSKIYVTILWWSAYSLSLTHLL